MRIILLSLAAIGAAAIAGAAPAQTTSMTTGHRGGMHTPPAGPSGDFFRSHRGFGRGGLHRGPRRHRGRSGRDRLPPFYFGLGGYGEPADPYGDGFFAEGGEVRMEGSRPVYDYDRAYPYEWDSAAAPASEPGPGWTVLADADVPRCRVERGVRVCRGGR